MEEIEFMTREKVQNYLKGHPLISMLGGMPLAICIFASQTLTMSLKEIYDQQLELIMFKGKKNENSMIISLEFMLKILSKTDPLAVDTFFMIGLMKNGLYLEDLETILMQPMKPTIDVLINSNLIDQDTNTGLLRVCPFIDYFVEMKTNNESRKKFIEVLSKYYEMKLSDFKDDYLTEMGEID